MLCVVLFLGGQGGGRERERERAFFFLPLFSSPSLFPGALLVCFACVLCFLCFCFALLCFVLCFTVLLLCFASVL